MNDLKERLNKTILNSTSDVEKFKEELTNNPDKAWRKYLNIGDDKQLVSSSMWTNRKTTPNQKIAYDLKDNCGYALFNHLELGSRIKISFCVFWEPVSSNFKIISDRSKITNFFSDLPNQSFLYELKDIDQLVAWIEDKYLALLIAKCWEAGRSSPDNPLSRDLDENKIHQWRHDYIWLRVSLYEHFWRLFQVKERIIQKALNQRYKYSFESGIEIFCNLIRPDFDDDYSLLLQSKYEHLMSEKKELVTLVRKKLRNELSPIKEERLTSLTTDRGRDSILCTQLAEICHRLAKRNLFIKSWLLTLCTYLDGLAAMEQSSMCDPALSQYGYRQSYTYINGILHIHTKESQLWKLNKTLH